LAFNQFKNHCPKNVPQKIVSGLNHVALFYALKYNTALLKYRAGTNNAPNWEATNIHLSLLRGQGHEIRIGLMLYGWIGPDWERVR
jgi:hypothetical protein